jgi:hypothetical protein
MGHHTFTDMSQFQGHICSKFKTAHWRIVLKHPNRNNKHVTCITQLRVRLPWVNEQKYKLSVCKQFKHTSKAKLSLQNIRVSADT